MTFLAPCPYPIPAVLALVRRADRVLLVRRNKGTQPDPWGFPGGKVEWGESLTEAAARELREETGLLAQAGPVLDCFDVIARDEQAKVRTHFVLTALLMGRARGLAQAGSDAACLDWFTQDQLRKLDTHPRVADLAAKALAWPDLGY